MKKITLLLLSFFFSLASYSQLALEGFESTTGPDGAPSTNWSLGTGNWFVFNNVASATSIYGITTSAPLVYQGTNAATCDRTTVFPDGTVENYLVTPAVTVPSNGQLHFWTRNFQIGTQGTVFQIKVAPAGSNPTDPNSYSLVQQWTDADLVTTFNVFQEKVVNLSAFSTFDVHIAFVMQQAPVVFPFGDRWFIDNVSVVEQCFDPTTLTAGGITLTTANLSWANPSGATSWEIEIIPAAATPTGTGLIYNGTLPYVATATQPAGVPFTATTAYKYYVRARCSGGTNSAWVGPFNFSTSSPGLSCNAPIQITSLPYGTTDSTANYSDNTAIEGSPGATGCGITGNYLNGNDVVYSYTAPANGTISVTMTPTGTNSGIFAYSSCANIGVSCVGGAAGTTTTVRTFNLSVTAGQTYFFVISSLNTTQTVGYNLVIQAVNCAPPTVLTASGITQTGANLGWAPGAATSWEVVVQTAPGTIPTGAGIQTNNNTNYPTPNPLLPNTNYVYYVRADCNDGSGNFSAWAGPFAFRTLCAPFNSPFQEGFNSTSPTEACWTVLNLNNDADSWNMNYTINPFEGNQSASILTNLNAGNNDDWLISPQIILNGNQRLKYRYRVQSATDPDAFRVMLSQNGPVPAQFTTTLLPLTTFNNITYQEAIISMAGITGAVNIGWHIPAGGIDGNRLYIDNVIIEDIPSCPEPSFLTSSAVLSTTATLTWTNGGTETQWHVLALPCGSPAPTATSTGFLVANTGSPYPLTGLTPTTCYDVYVRAVCPANDLSPWTGPTTFTTQVAPPVCGGQFVDVGGPTANYPNNTDSTVTICPTTPGDVVTVTFTAFNTETNWDALYVFNGNSIAATQIASTNGAGNVPGGLAGGFWGTAIPGPFTSSSVDGCLTFRFRSDGSVNNPGWVANVTCAPPPTCRRPTAVVSSAVTSNSVNLAWTQPVNPDNSVASAWEVLALPCGSPAPTATSTGFVAAATNPFVLTGLTPDTCYAIYIRAVCSATDSSTWAGPTTITTQIAPPVCGGQFVDLGGATANYPNGADSTVTICPTNPGDVVTVTFIAFNTETNWDALYVFDGNTVAAPQIASANGAGNVPGGLAGGYWGNLTANLPGPFTSSSVDGCLTFRFRSDGSINNPGWVASVTCAPAPNCPKPTSLTATNITSTSALLGWTELNAAVTQWEVLIVPAGSGPPLPTAVGQIVSTNPALFTGLTPSTQYTYYVRSICPTSGTSLWSNGFNFTTLIINDNCPEAIFAPVNSSAVCQQVTPGTLTGATASVPAPVAPCVGTADDDVWFQFIATNPFLTVSLQNITGTATNLNFGVYSGACGTLTQIFCSAANATAGVANGLVIGQTYFVRVYSNSALPQTVNFNLCISTPASCVTGQTACQNLNYQNTTGITSQGSIGCLGSSPNPTYYTIQVQQTGPINLLLTQSTTQGGPPNLDVDYAAWGPFTSQAAACVAIGNPPTLAPGIGVPVTQQTGCSFSAAPTETLNIANAIAGQFYVILITNFSNQPGFISLTQANSGATGSGTYQCCPDAFFTYTPVSYCKVVGATNPVAVISPGSLAGVFSVATTSPPGLVFANTTTGEIDLAASAPGNYLIVNTVAATASCEQKVKTYSISIVAPLSATIAYDAPAYCNNITALQPATQTGTTGGVYSATPNGGLFLNVATGAINPSLSSPGVYTVTYSIPGSNICALANPSTTVEILPLPNIPQPAAVNACNSYTLPAISVGSYYSQQGGTGTPLDISVPLTSSQTVYIYATSASGCVNEKSFTVTINSVPTPTATTTLSSCTAATGTITVTSPVSQTGATPTDLFISEVTDANSGSLTYIELYNGTGAAVNLATYRLKVYNNGSAIATCDLVLTGTMANNTTRVIAVGSNINQGGVVPNQVFATCGGVNSDDNIRLTTAANVEIDLWGRTDGAVFTPAGQPGYTYRRLASATKPSMTWNTADWTAIDPEDYSNVGSYTLATSNYEYSLDNGAFQSGVTFSNVAVGLHTVIVKDLLTNCLSAPLSVTIDAVGAIPAVTAFTYDNTPFCQNVSNPLPNTSAAGFTFGGVYSAPTGLVINPVTGEINLTSSTVGSYPVTYSVSFDPITCQSAGSSTFTVVINAVVVPVVGFSYTSPVCALNTTTVSPTTDAGFTAGGTFASQAGLSIDASTGVIDVAGSTAGNYTIIYSVAANASQCIVANASSPIPFVITPTITPVTTIDYPTSVCQNATTNPIPAGGFVSGGVFASTPGIALNTNTGEIDLANTTAGTYTITYTIQQNLATCSALSTSQDIITINPVITPVTGFSYTTPICQNAQATLSPTLTAGFTAGGTFSAAAGLSLNAVTGVIDLAASTAGSYTVTYTVAANAATCQVQSSSTAPIVITPVITPITGFSYTTPICQNAQATLSPAPIAGFTAGGTYSAGAGLSLDTATGVINLAASTAGTYTVTYTVAANASTCQVLSSSTAPIVITPVITPVTGFSYTTPICQNAQATLSPSPIAGFTAGGTYSAGAGLALNTTTGVIDLAASTAGSYTVTYTVAANAATCQVVSSATAPIVITAVITPVTGFSYTTPVCPDDANQSPLNAAGFTNGGSYTSTAGLSINASTGVINVSASSPGVYTVAYTLLPIASSCQLGGTNTAQIVINSPIAVTASGECQGVSFVLTASPVAGSFNPETAEYEWKNGSGIVIGSTQSVTATETGNYTVTVTSNGCSSTSAPFSVDNVVCLIQKGISANGDGLNDCFELSSYDVKNLQIFNRYGMKVYAKSGYTNQWCGQSDNGDNLPDGTYYYVINRNNGETKTGWIYINRAQ